VASFGTPPAEQIENRGKVIMSILLTELIKNPARVDELVKVRTTCAYCGIVLQEAITGNRKAPRGRACSDCYYEQIGEGIERHPVTTGKVRRG
jgi:hypothetical protein